MVTVTFTANLRRHLPAPTRQVPAGSLHQVLEAAFLPHPALRGYVLDDQGSVRRHVTLFIDGEPIRDRTTLADPVPDGSEVHVLQALSGG